MSYAENPYQSFGTVAQAQADVRAEFIRKTYVHLAMAVAAFVGLEVAFHVSGFSATMAQMLGGSRWGWLAMLGAFMVVSWVADSWARNSTSVAKQYAGLSLYVVLESLIFAPFLFFATRFEGQFGPVLIPAAAITLVLFGGLTVIVFITGKDFSFMRAFLMFGGLLAMAVMVGGIVFGFNLGLFFTVAMIGLACGYILYDTSNVMLHYRTDQHVAAALALFAAVALLFWYVLRLVMALQSRD